MEYIRTTKIIKTGTSLCVVIPKNILTALKFQRGDQVAFYVYDNETIVMRKIKEVDLLNLKLK
jgi:antitoxin component of MazEF toxin-antitoxin module